MKYVNHHKYRYPNEISAVEVSIIFSSRFLFARANDTSKATKPSHQLGDGNNLRCLWNQIAFVRPTPPAVKVG